MVWEVSTQPIKEPVSLEEAKTHLRVTQDCTVDDEYILNLISAARRWAEMYQGRSFFQQTQKLYLNEFPFSDVDIDIPMPPLASVTSITYVDTAGDTQTLSTDVYTVDTAKQPGRVYRAYNQSWPSTRRQRKAVTIEYVAGYGTDTSNVPAETRQAILIMIAHLFGMREMVITGTILREVPNSAKTLLTLNRMDII